MRINRFGSNGSAGKLLTAGRLVGTSVVDGGIMVGIGEGVGSGVAGIAVGTLVAGGGTGVSLAHPTRYEPTSSPPPAVNETLRNARRSRREVCLIISQYLLYAFKEY
jgi:hypothetical protein